MESVNKTDYTKRISEKLRSLRKARGFTQADLALRLGLGQGSYSRIENGASSLSAEQFLEVLRIFNVSVTEFQPLIEPGGDVQNALIRFGATHLLGDPSRLPNDKIATAEDVFREVLSDGSQARHLAALGPVFVKNHKEIRLRKLWSSFTNAGLEARLGWTLENIREAVRQELQRNSFRRKGNQFRAAERELETFLSWVEPKRETVASESGDDLLGLQSIGSKSRRELRSSASSCSLRWGILTRLTPADFLEALKASDDAN